MTTWRRGRTLWHLPNPEVEEPIDDDPDPTRAICGAWLLEGETEDPEVEVCAECRRMAG